MGLLYLGYLENKDWGRWIYIRCFPSFCRQRFWQRPKDQQRGRN